MHIKRFLETNLNFDELQKTSGGEPRGQKLINRLKSNQDFTVKPNGKPPKDVKFANAEEVVDNIADDNDKWEPESADKFLRIGKNYKKVFKGDDNTDYKLNDIYKDEYFGRSGGSSLGFENTRYLESVQCIIFSLKQKVSPNSRIDESHLKQLFNPDLTIRQDIMNFVRIPIDVDGVELNEYLNKNEKGWTTTLINTANAMWKEGIIEVENKSGVTSCLKPDKKYIFHQIGANSPLISSLSRAYKASPESGGVPIPKWTPSDVWAVLANSESTVVGKLNSYISRDANLRRIEQLNGIIDELFMENMLIGISLKKSGGQKNMKLVINKLTPPPTFTFEKIYTSSNPFGSKGIILIASLESKLLGKSIDKIFFRSFSGTQTISDISGEVDGLDNRNGKVGLIKVNEILGDCGVLEKNQIPTKEIIQSDPEKYTNDFLKSEIIRMNGMVADKVRALKLKGSAEDKTFEPTRANLISKYQALKLWEMMNVFSRAKFISDDENNPVTKRLVDEITQRLFYYAMAIENSQFRSPMYVRIISG